MLGGLARRRTSDGEALAPHGAGESKGGSRPWGGGSAVAVHGQASHGGSKSLHHSSTFLMASFLDSRVDESPDNEQQQDVFRSSGPRIEGATSLSTTLPLLRQAAFCKS